MKHYEVVAAIIVHDNQILCVRRGASKYSYVSGKYEFPGGKIELGESAKIALIREIKEELSTCVSGLIEFLIVDHAYPDFSLKMHCFTCEVANKEITLNEHTDAQWLYPHELESLDWAAADLPIVEKLMKHAS